MTILADDERVRPRGDLLQSLLDSDAALLERRFIGVSRHPHRLADDNRHGPERETDRGAVPVLESDAPAGGDRGGIDRATGKPAEHDDAGPGNPRDLRDVGG